MRQLAQRSLFGPIRQWLVLVKIHRRAKANWIYSWIWLYSWLTPSIRAEHNGGAPRGAASEGWGMAACAAEGVGRMVPSLRDAGAGAMLARYSPADSERAD